MGAVIWPCGNAALPIPANRTGRADFPHPALRLASPSGTRKKSQTASAICAACLLPSPHDTAFSEGPGSESVFVGSSPITLTSPSSKAHQKSGPAQASLTLRPAGSLSRPEATFVTRLRPLRLPARAARQLPDQSTTLRVDSSSTDDSRLRGALPLPDSCSAVNSALFDYLVGAQKE
jgi:hypothetical protein